MAQILDGKAVAAGIYQQIKKDINENQLTPCLAIIVVGHDSASDFYVRNLEKKGAKVGITVQTGRFEEKISEAEILAEISSRNDDPAVHGIIIQNPLPRHFTEEKINLAVSPEKDVDAFHPLNIGNMILARRGFIPSTPAAVLEILRYYRIETAGRKVVILGRSNVVGKPLANLLIRKDEPGNATVIVCHTGTKNLTALTLQADILIAAIGKANFVQPMMISRNAVVLDVGVNLIETAPGVQKYVGDVDFAACLPKCSMITPVPGGVGTVTTAMLLRNVWAACKKIC